MTAKERAKSNTAYQLIKKAKSKLGVYKLSTKEEALVKEAAEAQAKLCKEFGLDQGMSVWENNANYFGTKAYWEENSQIINHITSKPPTGSYNLYLIDSAHSAGAIDDDTVIRLLKGFGRQLLWDKIKSLFK